MVGLCRKHRDLAQVLRHLLLGFLSPSVTTLGDSHILASCLSTPCIPSPLPGSVFCPLSRLSWMQFASHLITVLRGAHMQDHCCLWERRWGGHVDKTRVFSPLPSCLFCVASFLPLPRQMATHFPHKACVELLFRVSELCPDHESLQ